MPASAQTLSAEDLMNMPLEKLVEVEVLITGASKYAEKSTESPSIVEIVTADDIKRYGYQTLGEAINGLHGIFTSNDRDFTTVGFRGFNMTGYSSSRILVMIDGRRMNENVYDAAYVGQEFMLDMALVDHIEIIPGPGSSIYGANAMMGVINVITKKGSDINGTQVETGFGTDQTGLGRATYGKTLENGANMLLSASGFYSGGDRTLYFPEYDNPLTNNGLAFNQDEELSKRLFAKVDKGNLSYSLGYVERFKKVPTAPYNSLFNIQGNDSTDTQAFGHVRYTKPLSDKSHLEFRGYIHSYHSELDYQYDDFFGIYTLTTSYQGRWAGGEANFVTTAFDKHKIVIGGELQYDIKQQLYDYDDLFIYQDSNRVGVRAGLFAQDSYQLTDNVIVSAGLRLDQHHMIKGLQLNPRLGLIWNPQPSTTVKLLYGSAFRAPNVYERDYDAFGSWEANPNNVEEHIRNYEAAAEWRGRDGLKLTGSVFFNEFTDVLSQDALTQQYRNTGQMRSAGAEIGIDKRWDNGREFKLSYNHTEFLKFEGMEWGATDAPKDVGKIRFSEPFFEERLRFSLENIYVGRRKTLYYHYANGYNLMNANIVGKDVIPGLDISLGIYNLLDSDVEMIGSEYVIEDVIPMDGRTFLFRLQKTF
ncbi:MAG TPA: TonB-dependent receptor [Patescibacteria group bacterium]|nr:TonB-dependent receptor [Patescibacteria group bacterium]